MKIAIVFASQNVSESSEDSMHLRKKDKKSFEF